MGHFIDFSKAFDTIDHKILIRKLSALNFSPNSVDLIENYLTNRTQSVLVNNSISKQLKINCGVPQGSILGPTLFLLYIYDLAQYAKPFNTVLFADDTNLFFKSKDLNYDAHSINQGLNIISTWCKLNKLTLNIDKTNFIIIKNPQNNFRLNKEISIDGLPITNANSIKFLGVTIDSKLNWSSHIENLRMQLRKSLGIIYQASAFLSLNILLLLYNSLINSKLVYCLEAWGNTPKKYLDKLYVIQKRLIRIIYHKSPTFHSASLFKKSRILPIYHLYTLRICLLAHDSFYKSHKPNHNAPYPTRHSALSLPLPASTSACGHRQVAYQMADAWNSLPDRLREMGSVSGFRVALKQHLLESLI